jgi:hypothetical protein
VQAGKRQLLCSLCCLLSIELCPALARGQQTPALAPKIVVLEGEGGVNSIRQATARELLVQVTDQDNRPLARASVTFMLPASGAGAAFVDGTKMVTLITDDKGLVRVVGMRPNSLEGKFEIRVTAAYQRQMARAVITQTNVMELPPAKPSAPSQPAAKKKGGSGKLIAILVAAAGGGVGAAMAARGGGSKGGGGPTPTPLPPTPTMTVIVAGSPTVVHP